MFDNFFKTIDKGTTWIFYEGILVTHFGLGEGTFSDCPIIKVAILLGAIFYLKWILLALGQRLHNAFTQHQRKTHRQLPFCLYSSTADRNDHIFTYINSVRGLILHILQVNVKVCSEEFISENSLSRASLFTNAWFTQK